MGAGTTPAVDVTLEAPLSVGLLLAWASENQADDILALLSRAFDAARSAGIQRLQDEGGWCVVRGLEYYRDDLQLQSQRHYLAGEHVDTPLPHEHLYIDTYTRSGALTHQAMLPEASLGAQMSYGRAMAQELEAGGLNITWPARTPAGWELTTVAHHAAATPRQTCRPSISVRQIVPADRWAEQGVT